MSNLDTRELAVEPELLLLAFRHAVFGRLDRPADLAARRMIAHRDRLTESERRRVREDIAAAVTAGSCARDRFRDVDEAMR